MAEIRSVTELKRSTSALVERVQQTGQPVVITQNGEAAAVLQDAKSYDETQQTLAMLKLVIQGDEDVRQGRVLTQDAVVARLARRRR